MSNSVWTKTAGQILESIANHCKRVNDSRHLVAPESWMLQRLRMSLPARRRHIVARWLIRFRGLMLALDKTWIPTYVGQS